MTANTKVGQEESTERESRRNGMAMRTGMEVGGERVRPVTIRKDTHGCDNSIFTIIFFILTIFIVKI